MKGSDDVKVLVRCAEVVVVVVKAAIFERCLCLCLVCVLFFKVFSYFLLKLIVLNKFVVVVRSIIYKKIR